MTHLSEQKTKAHEDLDPEVDWLNSDGGERVVHVKLTTNAAHRLARLLRREQGIEKQVERERPV